MVHAFCSSTAVLKVISQQHTTQNTNTTTVKVTTTIIPNESNDQTDDTKTTTDVVNETPSLFKDIKSPLKSSPVITSIDPVSSTHMIKCPNLMEIFFKNLLNYFAGHGCKPPAFVFLRIEPKPPWARRDQRDKTMILEDKDRFKARTIDTI
ncbi:hypothetical protein Tco_1219712 [Tanacetum coccineum]